MAQKTHFVVTVNKIVSPDKKVFEYAWPGKDVTIIATSGAVIIPKGASDEDCIILANGYEFHCLEDFDAVNTDISATDITGS